MSISIGENAYNIGSLPPDWRVLWRNGYQIALVHASSRGNSDMKEWEAVGEAVRACKSRKLNGGQCKRALSAEFTFEHMVDEREYVIPFGSIVKYDGVVFSASHEPLGEPRVSVKRRLAPTAGKGKLNLVGADVDRVLTPDIFTMLGWREGILDIFNGDETWLVRWPQGRGRVAVSSSVRVGPHVYAKGGAIFNWVHPNGKMTTQETRLAGGILHTDGQELFLVDGGTLYGYDWQDCEFNAEREDLPQHDHLAMWSGGICCVMRNTVYIASALDLRWQKSEIDPQYEVRGLYATREGPRILASKGALLGMFILEDGAWTPKEVQPVAEGVWICNPPRPGGPTIFHDWLTDTTYVTDGCTAKFGPGRDLRCPFAAGKFVPVRAW
jgi:hypothetical protein